MEKCGSNQEWFNVSETSRCSGFRTRKDFFIIWLCVCAIGEDTSVGHSRGLHLFGCIGLLCGIRERSVRPKIIGPWLQYTNILLNREVL